MVKKEISWDDLHVLLALLRAKTLSEAGRRLGLDASTVSRRIASLESALGAQLFARTREGLRATAGAERLLAHVETMEEAATSLLSSARAGETKASGIVRVATTEGFARGLVAGGLLDLRREHPGLAIEILGGNAAVDIARGDAEIAVRLSALRQPSLHVRSLARIGIGLYAAPRYLREHSPIRSADGLRGHEVVLPSGELSRLPEVRWLAARPGMHVTFRSNSMPALIAAAIAGHGILPVALGWGDAERELERVLVLDEIPKRAVWLVTHEVSRKRPAVRVVSARIVEIFARLFSPG